MFALSEAMEDAARQTNRVGRSSQRASRAARLPQPMKGLMAAVVDDSIIDDLAEAQAGSCKIGASVNNRLKGRQVLAIAK